MSTLRAKDFGRFFDAVHGYAPFPWQSKLAAEVCEEGAWPAALDVPTGAGKTSALDVAVFHLALEASAGKKRRAPVRIAFVVDRRLVVDGAAEHARELAAALASSTEGVVRTVADRLRLLAEQPAEPLMVARLRGGVPRESDWARTPSQPVILVSTVDQVGSRLLFRGYGVSDRMKPIHAGLLGCDSLVLLDEAHLSQPFEQTLRGLETTEKPEAAPSMRTRVVTLSATQTAARPFAISSEDRKHPVLAPRLKAAKPVELVRVNAAEADAAFSAEFAKRAIAAAREVGAPRKIAVVVNRVRRAREIWNMVSEELGAENTALLIGRSRPLDRDDKVNALLPRMRAKAPVALEGPLVVVATQCIEAGADVDFDVLLSELAPLDCLRQRFGRLNRYGRPIEAKGAVLAARDQLGSKAEDPLYLGRSAATWVLLEKYASPAAGKKKAAAIDFGLEASRRWLPEGEALLGVVAPREDAPVLLPSFVDMWAQTSPAPAVEPEPALFLHGPRSGPGEITIVWRDDLANIDVKDWGRVLDACPPSVLEGLSLPRWEVVRFLEGRARGEVSDAEAGGDLEDERESKAELAYYVYRGADQHERRVPLRALREGDVVVVHSAAGGCDEWGWNPRSTAPVVDRAEEANRRQRGVDVLRIGTERLAGALAAEQRRGPAHSQWDSQRREWADLPDGRFVQALAQHEGLPQLWNSWLREADRAQVFRDQEGVPFALRKRPTATKKAGPAAAATEDDPTSLGGGARMTLTKHSAEVRSWAGAFARQLGLSESLIRDLELAAFLHDAGKAHPLFKAYMYGGDELAALGGEALAKSGRVRLSRPRELPERARHEAASVRFALAHPALARAGDQDLVVYLVGSHHGWGRPFFPPVNWPPRGETFRANLGDGEVESIGALCVEDPADGWNDRFDALRRKYGTWGVAWLESIIRLADHRQSETGGAP